MPTPVSLTEPSTEPPTGTARTSTRPPSRGTPPALWRELDRVGQKIEHDLLELSFVRPNVAQPRVDGRLQHDGASRRPLPDEGHCVVDGRGQVEVGQLQLHPPGLDLGEIEDVV